MAVCVHCQAATTAPAGLTPRCRRCLRRLTALAELRRALRGRASRRAAPAPAHFTFRMPWGRYRGQTLDRVSDRALAYYLAWDGLDAFTRPYLIAERVRRARGRPRAVETPA